MLTTTIAPAQGSQTGSESVSLSTPPTTTGRDRPARQRWQGVAMAIGLLLIVAAGGMLVAGSAHTLAAPEPAVAAFPSVGTSTSSYQPGRTSGWHVHPGVHSVVVLSGTLTVYDEKCGRTEYAPGQRYLGGATPHVARNETPDVVDVVITFVYRPSREDDGHAVPAPAGCEIR